MTATDAPARTVPRARDTAAPVVSLRGAGARVGGRTLWSGVDLDVGAGEFVAVLGPNGVGKSTLVKVLLGGRQPSEGEVRVLGARPGRAGARVGYLPQRRNFDASLRMRGTDVVRLGWDGDRWGVPLPFPLPGRFGRRARVAAERVAEVIGLVGAESYAHRPIGRCSGGEQQRLLIAQALVRRPRLLLLDEPLDSLDLPNQAAVAALIGRICRDEGVAVVMVAHDVNPILSRLDRVVYLAEGGAVTGRPADVITSETLSRLYGTSIEVLTTSDGRLVVVGQPEAPARHVDRHGEQTAEREASSAPEAIRRPAALVPAQAQASARVPSEPETQESSQPEPETQESSQPEPEPETEASSSASVPESRGDRRADG
ncbi:metal ABC transporter ATP-binding protein [Streptomyces sp. 8L]|uniref:metal ABC transporter ATP-binding protein n=1 Tax=Streptomyces sp. 8L TaxID=2877242 RepID=UPI001CD67C49|nr:metal ABC transporter ATP-binding protein [Streptomyces sp. 8L]MCA1221707.1 ATP-binding cassette domain-containing protein [Streptomyces sp. 8L]